MKDQAEFLRFSESYRPRLDRLGITDAPASWIHSRGRLVALSGSRMVRCLSDETPAWFQKSSRPEHPSPPAELDQVRREWEHLCQFARAGVLVSAPIAMGVSKAGWVLITEQLPGIPAAEALSRAEKHDRTPIMLAIGDLWIRCLEAELAPRDFVLKHLHLRAGSIPFEWEAGILDVARAQACPKTYTLSRQEVARCLATLPKEACSPAHLGPFLTQLRIAHGGLLSWMVRRERARSAGQRMLTPFPERTLFTSSAEGASAAYRSDPPWGDDSPAEWIRQVEEDASGRVRWLGQADFQAAVDAAERAVRAGATRNVPRAAVLGPFPDRPGVYGALYWDEDPETFGASASKVPLGSPRQIAIQAAGWHLSGLSLKSAVWSEEGPELSLGQTSVPKRFPRAKRLVELGSLTRGMTAPDRAEFKSAYSVACSDPLLDTLEALNRP